MRNEFKEAAARGFFGSFQIFAEVVGYLPKQIANLYRKVREAPPVADGKGKPSATAGPN